MARPALVTRQRHQCLRVSHLFRQHWCLCEPPVPSRPTSIIARPRVPSAQTLRGRRKCAGWADGQDHARFMEDALQFVARSASSNSLSGKSIAPIGSAPEIPTVPAAALGPHPAQQSRIVWGDEERVALRQRLDEMLTLPDPKDIPPEPRAGQHQRQQEQPGDATKNARPRRIGFCRQRCHNCSITPRRHGAVGGSTSSRARRNSRQTRRRIG